MAHPTIMGLDTCPMSHAVDVSRAYSRCAHYFFLINYMLRDMFTGCFYGVFTSRRVFFVINYMGESYANRSRYLPYDYTGCF